jgi:hypothetical protein
MRLTTQLHLVMKLRVGRASTRRRFYASIGGVKNRDSFIAVFGFEIKLRAENYGNNQIK